MEKRILVISWFFPPVNSSEGLVTYKLLSNSKYEYDVYTQKNSHLWAYKKSDLDCNNIRRIFSKAKNLEDFEKEAISYFAENEGKYDVVMTRSMPEQDHKIGLELKKIKPNVKWIASFGDPIAKNPFTMMCNKFYNAHSIGNMGRRYIFSPKRIIKSNLYKRRYRKQFLFIENKLQKLQEDTLNKADCVIFNNPYQMDWIIGNKANDKIKDKSIILSHCFDYSLYKEADDKGNDNKKLNFSFLGHSDDIRTPHLLFEAIKILNDKMKDLPEKACFHFYGTISDKEKLFLVNNELFDLVKIHKPIEYLESLAIMKKSDWLIHIDADISAVVKDNIFFAAKLADYIGSGTNIMGITMINGIAKDILKEYGALTLEHCVSEIINYLYLIIYENYRINQNDNIREKYSATIVSKQFDDFLDEFYG